MPNSMDHFYGSHLTLFSAIFLLTDGSNITWLEPPPFETVTDASSISITSKTVIQGSLNEELSCKFNLTADLRIQIVSVKFRARPAVTLVPNLSPSVEPVFAKQFNAVWVPNKLTLILFNVTDAEEGQYCFEVITMGITSARTWTRKIQLSVLDPILTTSSSITASEDLIQAMVSGVTASEDPRQTMVSASITVPQKLIEATVSGITASEDPKQTMVSSITVSQELIEATVSGITASEVPRQTMVASITVSQDPIPTTDSSVATSKVGNTRVIIGSVLGVVAFLIIAIAIAIARRCYLKRRKRSKTADGCSFLAADGCNGNILTREDQREIQGNNQDISF